MPSRAMETEMSQDRSSRTWTRRGFLKTAAATAAAPYVLTSSALGGPDKAPASERIVMGAVGVGGRGTGIMRGAMGHRDVQMVAVCDVVGRHRDRAKGYVDAGNDNKDCACVKDFREITRREDIDAITIGTPDHWHALIGIDAMLHEKDVYCEKPETLTVREGRRMTDIARRYGRVFSGGSQRVWGDYNWFHKMIAGGRIGKPTEAFVSVGGPSGPHRLPGEPTPDDVDWNMWLGPAPWRPFHPSLIRGGFRPWRDYSGGGMTDWGCHTFGGALFALGLHTAGPLEVIPPNGKDVERLTYIYPGGVTIYHGGGWGRLCFRGTGGEIPPRGVDRRGWGKAPEVYIPNYKGRGGIMGDFLHCVRTREQPFRDIAIAHRTATHCHIGNIAYWLGRPLKWDAEKEEFLGDDEANRWLDRPRREPWVLT